MFAMIRNIFGVQTLPDDVNGDTIKPSRDSLPSQAFLNPILRGGRAISDTVHTMATDPNQQESELVRTVRHQLRHSQRPNVDAIGQPGGMLMTFRQVQITAEKRRTEVSRSVEHMEEEITCLRSQIERHEQSLACMQEMVARVHEEHVSQTRSVDRVQRRVHGHRITIDRALQQTQLALQEQSAVLTRQEVLVQKLEQRSGGVGNVLLESVYILVGMYVLQTPLFKYTIRLVTVHLDTTGRHRKWLPRFLQIFFFVNFMNICKTFTRRFNFTSSLWSMVTRGSRAAWTKFSTLTSLPDPPLLESRSPARPSVDTGQSTQPRWSHGTPGLASILEGEEAEHTMRKIVHAKT